MRPLDPAAAERVRSSELDRIARRADRLRGRAPFDAREVLTHSRRERSLRRYLLAFGLSAPARLEPDRLRTDLEARPRRCKLISRGQTTPEPDLRLVSHAGSDRTAARSSEALGRAAEAPPRATLDAHALRLGSRRAAPRARREAVLAALGVQAKVSHERGARALARLGIRVERLRSAPRVALTLPPLARVEHEHVAVDQDAAVDLHAHVPRPEHLPLPK